VLGFFGHVEELKIFSSLNQIGIGIGIGIGTNSINV